MKRKRIKEPIKVNMWLTVTRNGVKVLRLYVGVVEVPGGLREDQIDAILAEQVYQMAGFEWSEVKQKNES